MTFENLLLEQQTLNPHISIKVVPNSEIEKKGHSTGMTEQIINDGKLSGVNILIAQEPDEITKIKVLFHELGHAKDYLTRKSEIEKMNLDKKDFIGKSEYFAFENSLIEGLALHKKGRKDILLSLLQVIPTRAKDLGYEYGIEKIMKSSIWHECDEWVKADNKQ